METDITEVETMTFDKTIKDSAGGNLGTINGSFDTRRGMITFNVTSTAKDSADVQKQFSDFISYVRNKASTAGLTQFAEPTT